MAIQVVIYIGIDMLDMANIITFILEKSIKRIYHKITDNKSKFLS